MSEESQPLVQLAGSERAPLADATPAGQLDTSERAELTLVLRRRADLPAAIVEGPTVLTAGELAERYGADPADVDLVRQTLTDLGLEITAVLPATRRIKVAGTLGELSRVFGVTLQLVRSTGPGGQVVTHRYRVGPLYVPAALDGIAAAVLGLDTRPQFRAHFRPRAAAAQGTSYTPNQVADIYQFPAGTTGPARRSRSSNSAAASPPATLTRISAASASRFPRSARSAWTGRPTRRARIRPGRT